MNIDEEQVMTTIVVHTPNSYIEAGSKLMTHTDRSALALQNGVRYWSAETTGDLVIERPDGTVIRTEMGDGNAVLLEQERTDVRFVSTEI